MSKNEPLFTNVFSNDEIQFGQVKLLREKFSLNNNQDIKQHKILVNLKNDSFKKDISYPICRSNPTPNENEYIESLIESINKLAFDVYKHSCCNAFDNIVISPLSLFYLFKVFYLASTNRAEEDLSKLLHLKPNVKLNKGLLEKSFLVLIENLKNSVNNSRDIMGAKAGSKFELNSEAFAKDAFLEENYFKMLKNNFKFDLNESTSSLVLKYDELATRYKINKNDHFSQFDLFLILQNLIEFNFDWKIPFDATIEKATFTKSNNEKVKTELMRLNNFQFLYIKYPKGLPIRICEFPFKNEKFAFTIILPEIDRLSYIDNILDFNLFNQLIAEMKLTEVNSILPKFKINERSNLIKLLQSLNADSLINFNYKEHGLCLDKAFFDCEINVGYNSCVGSASTSLFLSRNPDECNDPDLFAHSCEEFNCTNPFIFFVRDVKSKLVIHMGKLIVPTNIS